MATNFPTSLDALTNPTGASSLTSPDHAGQHTDANDAIESLQAKVGVNGSAVTTSLDYRVRNIDATTAIVNGNTSTDLVAITQAGTGIALDVTGSSTVSSQTNVSGIFGTAASGRLLLGSITGNTPFIGSEGATTLAFTTNSTIRMRIDSDGNIGISNTPVAGRSFLLGKSMTGSIAPIGFFSSGQIQSDATNSANYFNTFVNTAATAFTCGTVNHYKAQQGTIGAGSSIGTQVGFFAESSLIGATGNNLGFWGAIPVDAAKNFNLYMSGTAPNYLLGRLGVGATLTSGAMAQVVNTTAGDKAFVIKGHATQSGDLFDIQSSAGTSQFRVDSNVNLLLGATSRRSVGGAFQTTSQNAIFNEQGNGLTPFTAVLNRADSNSLRFVLGKSRGATVGSVTALVDGDGIAEFHFAGADGTTLDPLAARIMVHVDGAVATGSVPGRLSFATNPVAGTNPVERMRIDSSGNVGIGTSSPTVRLEVAGSTTISSQTNVAATFGSATSGRLLVGSITGNTPFIGAEGASNLIFTTNATERMRITSAGNIGIGNAGGGDTNVSIGTNITGATTAYGIRSLQTIQSGVTTTANIFISQPSTASAAFTLTDLIHFRAHNLTIGSTSAVTNQFGFSAGASLTAATGLNVGFHGNIASNTNRYNLYMDGTAQNYLAGNLGIGITVPTSKLHVVNTTAGDKALVVKAAALQSGSLLEVQNSSGTALVTIDSAGKVGIGNTAPENTLDITGSFGRGNPAVKTANFTLAGTENWIICNGAGTISITLPTPSTCDGREFGIKTVSPQLVQSASSNVIAIGGGAAGTAILPATSGAWAILVSDGSSWNIMCRGT